MARLWLFGGKGGVGKTTSACSTAIWLANSGIKTLIVSSDPAHSTSDSFEQELGSTPTKIEGYENLWGMELDPESRIAGILPKFSSAMSAGVSNPLQSMMGVQFSDIAEQVEPMDTSSLILPGLDEAIAFDQLLEYVENPYYDCILFDTAPTGHTLRFLALPEILEESMDRLLKIYRMAGGIKTMLFGRKEEEAIRTEKGFRK
jgi:arsenite-transporting ATPase